ncbi:MAG: Serine/threonine-protein kinase PrkC, partial [Planctomycetota bacterium]
MLAFESDAWIARAARAEEPVLAGELAGYRLARLVARGAQGTVYEAVEPRTGRRVAIKRLLGGSDGSLEDTRFSRETSVLGALAHPNIVSLLSAPVDDGARLLVMEWVDGESFEAWADGVWGAQAEGAAARTIARAVADAARAVAAAHALGIVHRDLKPSNVLVARDGSPKVLDFGLAKALSPAAGAAEVTRTNGFAGTPSWAAPEQIDGDPRAIDARTDVHALGLLAFRALAGRAAFDASLPIGALFESIRARTPAFTAVERRHVPKELALVVLRALEKEPARRYAHAGELADDLARFLAGAPVEAHPPSALYLARTLVRRHRAASAAIAVALAAVVAGAGASLAFAIDATRARGAETARADEAVAARLRAERMNGFFEDLLGSLRERDATGEPSSAREIIA